jgi:hypothetical protein
VQQRANEANCLQKLLETANIELGMMATDVLGASARAILRALISVGNVTRPDWPSWPKARSAGSGAAWPRRSGVGLAKLIDGCTARHLGDSSSKWL